jgi:preprotein translocase subunit SecF
MICLSSVIIVAGIVLFAVRGFNLGIDFRGGLNQQIQIAPVAMTLAAEGADKIEVSSFSGEREILGGDALQFTTYSGQESTVHRFAYEDFATLGDLAEACRTVPGVTATVVADPALPTARLFPLDLPVDITRLRVALNHTLASGELPYAGIARVRESLSSLGEIEVQTLGPTQDQQFMLKVAAPAEDDPEFRANLEQEVKTLLSAEFRSEEVIVRRTDFVGPSLAGELVTQTISVIGVALVLMLVYLTFRFRFEFALATILCVMHDAAVMVTATLLLGLELSTNVVAAMLTIIGYSVNDTIVIFDRVRENMNLMRDTEETMIFDTSVSQTLGRTLITSFVTLLAVVALYIFTSGSLKDFALLLIVGIVVGSYSTIYIASPIVMLWHRIARRSQRRRDEKQFGAQTQRGEPQRAEPQRGDGVPAPASASPARPEEGRGDSTLPAADGTSGDAAGTARSTAAGGAVVRLQPSRRKRKRR